MILRIYSCCQHDNRLVLGVPKSASNVLVTPTSSHRPPKSNQIDTDRVQAIQKPTGPITVLFLWFKQWILLFFWVHHDDHVEFNQQCWTLWFAPSGRGRILFGWLFSCAVFTAIASYTKSTTRRTGNVQTSARAHQSVFTISNVWPRRFIDSRVLICL